jgi:ABC-type polysaccharide/polyol phosphate transport system ATPase subunit
VTATAPAIRAEGLGKRYWLLEERPLLVRSLLPFARPARHEFWALRDVDVTVARGETVGVLGRNGAGKTTLLRLLAGVTRPTEGRIAVAGRVAPLISVGVGFHREMTGRENVYVNGMLLGLTRAEIDERFEAIVRFAELGEFIDTPVKFYSSGMFMRLGFAVAVHTDPDVLLVDEVLAVGDQAFQLRCLERMRQIRESGATILLVSHSLAALRLLCPRTLLIRRGRLEFDGPTEGAIARHHELLAADADEAAPGRATGAPDGERAVVGGATIVARELLGPDGPTRYVPPGMPLCCRLRVRFDRPVDSPMFTVAVVGDDGGVASGLQTPVAHAHRAYAAGEEAEVDFTFTANLGGGGWRITTSVLSADGRAVLAADHAGLAFYVEPRPWAYGPADLAGTFVVDGRPVVDHREYRLG